MIEEEKKEIERKKMLIFDTETTGTDTATNDIISCSGCISVGLDIKEWFDFYVQPFDFDNIDEKAVEIHGISIKDMKSFEKPYDVYNKISNLFNKYIDKFDSHDKFYPMGYNVNFDLEMLNNFFLKNGDKYFGSWQNWISIDVLHMINLLHFKGNIPSKSRKLEHMAKLFGVQLNAHDALSDIQATIKIFEKINGIEFNKNNAKTNSNKKE